MLETVCRLFDGKRFEKLLCSFQVVNREITTFQDNAISAED